MTTSGWAVMILSVGSVITLITYCLCRVFTLPPVDEEENHKGPPDNDTADAVKGA